MTRISAVRQIRNVAANHARKFQQLLSGKLRLQLYLQISKQTLLEVYFVK